MGAFEIIAGFVKNPGAELKPLAAFSGQTYVVRATTAGATLENAWAENASGGVVRVKSTRMHDNTQGIRWRAAKKEVQMLMPFSTKETLYPTDTLTVESSGGGSEVDTAYLLAHYDNIEGSNANVRSWAEVQPQVMMYMGVEVTVKTGAEGVWGKPVALNTSMDLFKRPMRYAILGYQLDTTVGAVALSGIEPGQLRQGGPGTILPDITSEWFIRLSAESGQPAIPVFDSQNVGSCNVEIAGSEAEVERHVTFLCAMLRS
jgi:hypothetical protein